MSSLGYRKLNYQHCIRILNSASLILEIKVGNVTTFMISGKNMFTNGHVIGQIKATNSSLRYL